MKFKQHNAMCSICATNGNGGNNNGGNSSNVAVATDDGKGNITISGIKVTNNNGNIKIGG